ncbi:MAG: class I SAM-dependent methyltransferase [Nitrospirota bacterium]
MFTSLENVIKCYSDDNFYEIQGLNPLVVEYTNGLSGAVLDLGAGTGTNSNYLLKKGFKVTAVEINPKAAILLRQSGIRVLQQDVTKLKWRRKDYYSLILCLYVFQHLKDKEIANVIKGMQYSLKTQGIIIISSFLTQSNTFSLRALNDFFCQDKRFKIMAKDNWQRLDTSHNIPHYHEGFYVVVQK